MQALAEKLCEIGRRAYGRGLIAGAAGNFSCRLDARRVLCTPTGLCKGRLTPDDLCLVDLSGRPLGAGRQRSSELLLHLAIYAADARVGAVVHTHPPFATTFAALGRTLPAGMLPEAEILLGPVPLVPYQTPGTAALAEALAARVRGHVAAILENHGAVTWGPDPETAWLRTETLEAACRVAFQARQIGSPRRIARGKLRELAELRARRGAPPAGADPAPRAEQ